MFEIKCRKTKQLKIMTESNFKFIIIGAGRGGTSLLTGLLDYHSRLEVHTEYASISHLMGRGFKCTDNQIIPQRITTFIELCQEKSREAPDKIWGNKITTEQIHALEEHNIKNPDAQIDVLACFFNMYFKDYKKIFILRDGRACVDSKVRRTGQSMQAACDKWKYSVSVYKYLQGCENSISIKFEDLLLYPRPTLQAICNKLSIKYEENMLKGVANKKLMQEYQNSQLLTEKARVVDLPEEYLALIREELVYSQYLS